MREWIVPDADLGCDGEYFDYEEVVRCKDCRHYKFTNEYAFGFPEKGCELTGFNDVDDDDFCSRGRGGENDCRVY